MQAIEIFTDGAARKNPGRGGFGTILKYVDSNGKVYEKEITAGFDRTTNNRMEMLAVIKGFEALNHSCKVDVYSDSKYIIDTFNKHWIDNWQKYGWKNFKGEPVKNKEMWLRLLKAMQGHVVEWHWVKGHAGHKYNERCDSLATGSADRGRLLHDDGGDLRGIC